MHTITVTDEQQATEQGALPGWNVLCSCGELSGWSVKSLAEEQARAHQDWHKGRP